MDDYQKYIYTSRYARYLPQEDRREEWGETVERYISFFSKKFPENIPYEEIKSAILNLEVMPSMRALMTAGPALERDAVCGYNCSYVAVNHPRVFDEILYILCCGTGVGFSVERQDIAKLPEISEEFHESDSVIVVADSKIGWASAFRELISMLYAGKIPTVDYSHIRKAGEPLKIMGGRASGPEPLKDLFDFTIVLFKKAKGRKLSSIECHDLVCKIADIVVVGGVRRSALISLSNLTDARMQNAKSGAWWENEGQRALANNSVAYTEKPDIGIFIKEWLALYESKSGERGIFNRVAAKKQAAKTGRRNIDFDFGTNPCGEIILRPSGFCNLSEVVARDVDTFETLKRKVEIATVVGTLQSTLTDFRYLRSVWKKNAEEERLLGVSITGIMDNAYLAGIIDSKELSNILDELKQVAIDTNKKYAEILGIEPSASITTVKPSGTVSQLVDSASGIHPRYAPYYIRTVRADVKDPLATFMQNQGVSWEVDVMKPASGLVFSFPMKAPDGAMFRDEISAIDQLEHYRIYKEFWCEHNPSITVYVREDEWFKVGAWVYENFDIVGGLTFLPHSDHSYKQAPYQEISKEQYIKMKESFPKIDWEKFREKGDNTTATRELACISGVCEI